MKLDTILAGIEIASELIEGIPGPVGALAALAEKLAKIGRAANAAHVKITGQPIDLTQLHEV